MDFCIILRKKPTNNVEASHHKAQHCWIRYPGIEMTALMLAWAISMCIVRLRKTQYVLCSLVILFLISGECIFKEQNNKEGKYDLMDLNISDVFLLY